MSNEFPPNPFYRETGGRTDCTLLHAIHTAIDKYRKEHTTMPKLMTKAELHRRLKPGTKLILINSLIGPTNQPRTVELSKPGRYAMRTQRGSLSYLNIDPNEYIMETDNGFEVWHRATDPTPGQPARDAQLMAAYTWVPQADGEPTPGE